MSFLSRAFRAPPPPYEPPETRDWSVSDPAIVTLFGGAPSLAGVSVTEQSALGLSAVWRCVSLISGSIASLPLRTIRTNSDGTTQRTRSWLDNPAGPDGVTAFEWVESILFGVTLHGNWFGLKIFGGAGQLLGLQPVHPQRVSIEVKDARKRYRVSLENGRTLDLTDREMVHIPGLSSDGVRGLSPLTVARNGAFGTGLAADRTAAKQFGSGLLVSALATFEEDVSEEDAQAIQEGLDRKLSGGENAGKVALLNRKLNIHPLQLSNDDLQFLGSREFQTSELARIYGVPSHLVGLEQKNSSWGSGISEMSRGFAKYTLVSYTSRIEQRLSRLLPDGLAAEFDYTAFVQPDPEKEINLLIAQVQSGMLTVNEARRIRNMPPIEGGDVLRSTTPQPEAAA